MARLNIPADAKCLTPGCRNSPDHVLSMRMRRVDTGAAWAPNMPAYLCQKCATLGAEVTLLYKPNKTGIISLEVMGVKTSVYRNYDLTTKRDVK